MALHADQEVAVVALDRLDNAIGRPADRMQPWCDLLERLVVQRVGREAGGPKELRQLRARLQVQVMGHVGPILAGKRAVMD